MYPFIRTSSSYRIFQRTFPEMRYEFLADAVIDAISEQESEYTVSISSANPFFRSALHSGRWFDLLAVSGADPLPDYSNAENGVVILDARVDSITLPGYGTPADQSAVVRQSIALNARSVSQFSQMRAVGMPPLSDYCNYIAAVVEHKGWLFALAISVSASLSVSILSRSPQGAWKKNPLAITDLATPTNARLWPFNMALSGAFLIVTVDVSTTNASPTGRQNVVAAPLSAVMRADNAAEVKVADLLSLGQTPRCTYLHCDKEGDGMLAISDGSLYSIARGGMLTLEPPMYSGSGETVGQRNGDTWVLMSTSSSYSSHILHTCRRGRWLRRTAYGIPLEPAVAISMRGTQIIATTSSGAVWVAESGAMDFAQAGTLRVSDTETLDIGGALYQCSGDTLYRGLDYLSVSVDGLVTPGTSPGTPRYSVIGRPIRTASGIAVCGAISPRQNILHPFAAAQLFSSAKPVLMEVEC